MKSPFKFLEAYTKEDKDLFFGRNKEIEELFHRVFKSNLLLVYGASGTGKTSLILCGLATKFSDENWFSLYIRRQDNINASLFDGLRQATSTELSPEDLDPDEPELLQLIESLYLEQFKPIYLVFDQLEELFILGSEEEQEEFYRHVKLITESKLSCTVILIIREEYIAYLSSMEAVVHKLFDNRIRIERMRTREVREVIDRSCTANASIVISDSEKEVFLEQVIDILSEDELTVELTYLQVYLDKLYKNAYSQDGVYVFDPALIERTGKVDDVLAEFLEEQVNSLETPDIGWKILKSFITKDGTKKSASQQDIKQALANRKKGIPDKTIATYIKHFLNSKILTELEHSPEFYEFTHDSLAVKTFEKLDAKERNLFDIENLIDQQYQSYKRRKTLMDRDTYLYVKPYLDQLELDKDKQKFISKSRRDFFRKRRNYIASVVVVVLLLIGLTGYSWWNAREAQAAQKVAEDAQQDAEENLEKFQVEQKTRKSLEIDKLFDNAQSYINAGYIANALGELDNIKAIDSTDNTLERIKRFKSTNGL